MKDFSRSDRYEIDFAHFYYDLTIYFQFPLTLPGKWLESRIHGDVVTQMRLSLDDKRLITASRDGSLCFWKVRAKFVTNLKNLPILASDVVA